MKYPKQITDHNGTKWFHQFADMYAKGKVLKPYVLIMKEDKELDNVFKKEPENIP